MVLYYYCLWRLYKSLHHCLLLASSTSTKNRAEPLCCQTSGKLLDAQNLFQWKAHDKAKAVKARFTSGLAEEHTHLPRPATEPAPLERAGPASYLPGAAARGKLGTGTAPGIGMRARQREAHAAPAGSGARG